MVPQGSKKVTKLEPKLVSKYRLLSFCETLISCTPLMFWLGFRGSGPTAGPPKSRKTQHGNTPQKMTAPGATEVAKGAQNRLKMRAQREAKVFKNRTLGDRGTQDVPRGPPREPKGAKTDQKGTKSDPTEPNFEPKSD